MYQYLVVSSKQWDFRSTTNELAYVECLAGAGRGGGQEGISYQPAGLANPDRLPFSYVMSTYAL